MNSKLHNFVAATPYSVDTGKLVDMPPQEIWVRGSEDPNRLARDILAEVKEHEFVDLAAIGAAALNQAVKAIAIARGKRSGIVVLPFFSVITDDKDRERTRMMMRVFDCAGT